MALYNNHPILNNYLINLDKFKVIIIIDIVIEVIIIFGNMNKYEGLLLCRRFCW